MTNIDPKPPLLRINVAIFVGLPLAALLLVHSAAGVYDMVTQRIEEKRLGAAIEQTFRVAMPGVERIVEPRLQMQQRLGGAAGADPAGLLGRLGPLAQAMTAVPGVRVQSMGWRDRNLDLRISAPSGLITRTVTTVSSTLPETTSLVASAICERSSGATNSAIWRPIICEVGRPNKRSAEGEM